MISHRFRDPQIEAENADRQLTIFLGRTQRRTTSPNLICGAPNLRESSPRTVSHRFRNPQIEAEKADRQLTLYLGGTQRRSPSPNPINLRSPESAGIFIIMNKDPHLI